MDGEDFLFWLGGIARLSPAQRLQALASLSEGGETDGSVSSGAGGSFGATALGSDPLSSCRAEGDGACAAACWRGCAQGGWRDWPAGKRGYPHSAGRDIVAWGSANDLARYRCKSCGRTFNALTKTPMARLRKKASMARLRQGDDRTASPRLRSAAMSTPRRRSAGDTGFLGSPALDKPKTLSGIVEADETFILESFKGRRSRSCPPAAQAQRRGAPPRPLLRKYSGSGRP